MNEWMNEWMNEYYKDITYGNKYKKTCLVDDEIAWHIILTIVGAI